MTSTDMTADELRDLAARMYRACVARQARIAKRDEEARRAHAAILARCDEVERELRELRDDHIETLAHLVACVEVLGLPRDTDGPALVEAVRARALPRAEVRAERLERHAQEAARGLVHVHIDEPVSLARGHHIDEPVRDVVERSFYNRDRAAWSERAKRAESQLALAMTWGAELADAVRCEASLRWRWEVRTDEARRALSIAETKSAGADVIVADAEARRVAAEMRAIQAEGRAERLERELAEARRGYDTVTAALEGGTGDPLASALRRAEKAERERDEIDAHKCQLSLMLRDAQRALGARKRVRIIAREPLDPAPQSPPIEIILTSGPAGILFHVADAGSVGVLEDFLRYLGHEIVVDKPATLASPIANTGLDELGHDVERDEGDT